MTTLARARFDLLENFNFDVDGFDFTIDFAPILEIEQLNSQARNFVFPENRETLFLNDGIVRDFISGRGTADVVTVNFGVIGSSERADTSIMLAGSGQRVIWNDGDILGSVQLGGGDDQLRNFDLIDGSVRTAGGNDIVTNSGTITDLLNTGSGDDVVLNSGDIGFVNLGDGDDLYVGLVADGQVGRISAGTGDDTVRGGNDDERIVGGGGNDLLQGNDGADRLIGGRNKDVLQGGNGDDVLFGGNGKDSLFGGNDDDRLNGGTGQDSIFGGRGDDTLAGESGADVFVFGARSGQDVVTDFADGDMIRLSQVVRGERLLTFDRIEAFISYADNDAVIDLDGLYLSVDLDRFTGGGSPNSITVLNVGDGGLGEDDFLVLPFEPVVVEVL